MKTRNRTMVVRARGSLALGQRRIAGAGARERAYLTGIRYYDDGGYYYTYPSALPGWNVAGGFLTRPNWVRLP